jgi:hypothetical protein
MIQTMPNFNKDAAPAFRQRILAARKAGTLAGPWREAVAT